MTSPTVHSQCSARVRRGGGKLMRDVEEVREEDGESRREDNVSDVNVRMDHSKGKGTT